MLLSFILLAVTFPPSRVAAQSVSDCTSYTQSQQWALASEACGRSLKAILAMRCAGENCPPLDLLVQAEGELAFAVVAENLAAIQLHYGNFQMAAYWLRQGHGEAQFVANLAKSNIASPMVKALGPDARALAARENDELAVVSKHLSSSPPKPRLYEAPSASPPPKASSIAECNRAATMLTAVSPDYPDSARETNAVGDITVQVQVDVAADGRLAGAIIYKSSGNSAMDAAAIRAATLSTYSPRFRKL
jgi:TonB family protein